MAARTATVAPTRGRKRKKSNPVVRFIKRTILVLLTLTCILFIVGALVFASEFKIAQEKLTNLPMLMTQLQMQPTTIYSADGKPLYVTSAEYRLPVEYKDIPKSVRDATVAAEDVRFYKHHGVDIQSLLRIAVEAMRDKKLGAGGSTLTMQLAKRLYTSPKKTLKRKIQDMALAIAMERQLTKEQILTMYLNDVFFGSGAYGIKAASEVYLGKPLSKVDLSEAALLVRCVRRPSDETPFSNLKKAIENRNSVLKVMRDEGMVTDDQYDKATKEKPRLNPKPPSTTARLLRAPYFVSHVLQVLKQDMPDINFDAGGYKVYTTLDNDLEKRAEKAVRDAVEQFKGYRVTTGAVVLIDHKGRILAEVGGEDYNRNQFNVITMGRRQPGSSFKSVVYSAGIAQGAVTADGSVSDAPFYLKDQWTGQVWAPKNDNGRSGGMISVKTAFAYSYNLASVNLTNKIGPSTVVDYAKNVFGFTSDIPPYMSIALGTCEVSPLEMARAYSIFMTGGDRVEPYPIDRVVGPDGTVVRKYEPRISQNILDPRIVNQMRELQRAVVENGTGTRANVVPNARGKTGTTQDNKDAWFCGYSDGLEAIAWVANERRENGKPVYYPMSSRAFGGTTAIHIWVDLMKKAHEKYAVKMEDRTVAPQNPDAAFATKAEVDRANEPDRAPEDPSMVPPPQPNVDTSGATAGDAPDPTPPDEAPGDATDEPPAKPVEKPKPAPPPVQYVDVEICADSHELATMYCPETVVRTYIKGQEPKKYCHLHGPR